MTEAASAVAIELCLNEQGSGMRLRESLCAFFMLVAILQIPRVARAAEGDEKDAQTAIRTEEETATQIADVVHNLADIYGSRLTGSPAAANAAEWAVEQLRAWGMSDAHRATSFVKAQGHDQPVLTST